MLPELLDRPLLGEPEDDFLFELGRAAEDLGRLDVFALLLTVRDGVDLVSFGLLFTSRDRDVLEAFGLLLTFRVRDEVEAFGSLRLLLDRLVTVERFVELLEPSLDTALDLVLLRDVEVRFTVAGLFVLVRLVLATDDLEVDPRVVLAMAELRVEPVRIFLSLVVEVRVADLRADVRRLSAIPNLAPVALPREAMAPLPLTECGRTTDVLRRSKFRFL